MKRKYPSFQFKPGQYISLIETAVLNPNNYAAFLKNLTLLQSLIFFLINTTLWLLLSAVIRTFLTKQYHLFFIVFFETLILIAAIFSLLLFFTVVLHIAAKIFGSRAKIKNNLKAILFSTILFPLFAIPIFKVLAAIISIYILIFSFKTANHFDKLKAVVPVAILVGVIVFVLYSLGIVNLNLIT